MGADGLKLVIRTVQVCVGHDNDLHEVRFWELRSVESTSNHFTHKSINIATMQ
jgi:hypothetical protein